MWWLSDALIGVVQLFPATPLAPPLSWVLAASTVAIGGISLDFEHVALALADDWEGRGGEGRKLEEVIDTKYAPMHA